MKTNRILLVVIVLVVILSQAPGQTFTNVQITTNTYDQSEPAIALSPLSVGDQLVVWNDFEDNFFSQPGYAFTTNGGGTWNVSILPDIPNTNLRWGFDPSAGIDRYGFAYYCYIAAPGISLGPVYVSRTTNFGTGWFHKQVSTATTNQDKPFMTVDNTGIAGRDGRIYVSWTDFSSSTSIKFAYSTDHGATFSSPITLSTGASNDPSLRALPEQYNPTSPRKITSLSSGQLIDFVQGSVPAVAVNGDVYVIWTRSTGNVSGNAATVEIRKSTNGGVSFSSTITAANFTIVNGDVGAQDIRSYLHSSIAVDPVDANRIFICFTDYNAGDWDGKFVRSTDGGSSWSTPIRSANINSGYQYFQWLAVYPTGKISVVFYHTTDLLNVNTYIAESIDNGQSFVLVTPAISSQSSNPGQASWTYHYIGQSAATGFTFPVWVDHRAGNADIFWVCVNRPSTSSTLDATNAGGSGRKTGYTASNSMWHSVFQSNGMIIYANSTTDGTYWNENSSINGSVPINSNSSPSIATSSSNPTILFTSSNGLYFNTKFSGNWLAQPRQLGGWTFRKPSLAIDNSGFGHAAWIYAPEGIGGQPSQYIVYYGKFNVNDSLATLQDQVSIYTGVAVSGTSIALDGNQKPHVVWSRGGEIYYRNKVGSSWSAEENISNNSGNSQNPTISSNGTTIYTAWQDGTSGNDEIYYRVRTGSSWETTQNISNTSGASTYPAMNGPIGNFPVILWSDNTGGNWDIKYVWMGDGTVNTYLATSGTSSYPTFSFKQLNQTIYRLYAIWTEGSGAPFEIPPTTKDISTNAQKPFVGGDDVTSGSSERLLQNYPNPFNPSTLISYRVPDNMLVSLKVYDVLGREVATLVDEFKQAGHYSTIFDASNLPSGMYFYKMVAGNYVALKKLVVMK